MYVMSMNTIQRSTIGLIFKGTSAHASHLVSYKCLEFRLKRDRMPWDFRGISANSRCRLMSNIQLFYGSIQCAGVILEMSFRDEATVDYNTERMKADGWLRDQRNINEDES